MAKTKPIRIGIVGLGRAGIGMHCLELKNRTKKFKIVAACDPVKARREKFAAEYGCPTYRTFEEMLADDNVELIDIASRTPQHVEQTLAALKAGKNTFLEKPISETHAEARKLKAADAKSKGNLYIRHNRRFEKAFLHIQEIMASGILGDIFEIRLCRHSYQRRDDWQTIMKCGGGMMLNWGPHIIDHGLRLLESPLADMWSNLKLIAAVGDAEDTLKIIMTGKNGRIIDISISGGMAVASPEWTICGSKGVLTCTGDSIQLKYLDPKLKLGKCKAKVTSPDLDTPFGNAEKLKWIEKNIKVRPKSKMDHDSIWDYLYDTIRNGKEFPITLDEAIEVMKVVSAAKKGTPFDTSKK